MISTFDGNFTDVARGGGVYGSDLVEERGLSTSGWSPNDHELAAFYGVELTAIDQRYVLKRLDCLVSADKVEL